MQSIVANSSVTSAPTTNPINATIKVDGSVPIEIKHQQLDGLSIFFNNIPFLVTIAVVLCSAIFTYKFNKRIIENQDKQSSKSRDADHENKISEFRHNWLQEVRKTASELIKSMYAYQNHLVMNNLSLGYRDDAIAKQDLHAVERHQKDVLFHFEKMTEHSPDVYMSSAKLKLLFKIDDKEALKLFPLIDGIRAKMSDIKLSKVDVESIDELVSVLQVILKNEWEITKERNWRK